MISVLAHGVGSRGDLPLPLWQFAWAAVAALAISFIALGARWTEPRLAAAAAGRRLRLPKAAVKLAAGAFGVLALGLTVLVIGAGLFGVDDPDANIAPVAIYVVLWVGLAVVAGLVGDLWTFVSPFDRLARWQGLRSTNPPSWAEYFAPILAFLFLVLELVHPSGSSPRLLGIAAVLYAAVITGGLLRWGMDWLRRNEVFSALFGAFGAMAPFGSGPDGGLRWRLPLSGLATMKATPALTALLLVVLGGTSFDGFAESALGRDLFDLGGRWGMAASRFVGLVLSIVVIAALYLVATRFSAKATGTSWRAAISDFTPSLVPIAFGYTVAHYAQLLIDESQTFVFRLSDPLGRGWDVFGMADSRINFNLVSVDLIAWLQVLGIVIGHIAAVVVAHDRAIERHDAQDAMRSQLAMLFVMVLYSVLGLWLLLNA